MALGSMNKPATLATLAKTVDSEGFTTEAETTVASIRVYQEGRHGSERWANLASFSEATDLFRFRRIPGVEVTTKHYLVLGGVRYDIVSVEDVRGRGVYVEALAKRVEASDG